MPQLFKPGANTIARFLFYGGLPLLAVAWWVGYELYGSSYVTGAGLVVEQPVPFSHQHHVGQLGIDCRYCHASVERSPFAGMPSSRTCMTCHSQIWKDSPMLAPVRESFRTGAPIRWARVTKLPDYVYFDHSVHVSQGVSCVDCHGRLDLMPLTHKASPLRMKDCLACHRDAHQPTAATPLERYLAALPGTEQPFTERTAQARLTKLVLGRGPLALKDCYACHR